MNVNTNYSQLWNTYGTTSNSTSSASSITGMYTGLNSVTQEIMSRIIHGKSSESDSGVNQNSWQYVSNLKTNANGLKAAVNNLQSGVSTAKAIYTSSDDEQMTVQSPANRLYNHGSSSVAKTIKIEQLAAGQKNEGAAMTANDVVATENVGAKQFEIEVGGKTHQISFDVKEGDTNKTMQEKMAAAINSADIGVKASVSTADGKSSLSIEATGTGTGAQGRFSIRDVSGGAVELTGADSISAEAQNALYYVNGIGVARHSASNTVDIGGGATATLKEANNVELTVSKGLDSDSAMKQVQKFVDSYNGLYKLARDNESLDTKLFSKLVNTSKTYAPSLAKIGITFNSGGEMTIDEDLAKESAIDGSLQSFFGSGGSAKNYGYMSQLTKISDDVRYNTGSYVDREAMYANLLYSATGVTASNQSNMVGMLFNLTY